MTIDMFRGRARPTNSNSISMMCREGCMDDGKAGKEEKQEQNKGTNKKGSGAHTQLVLIQR